MAAPNPGDPHLAAELQWSLGVALCVVALIVLPQICCPWNWGRRGKEGHLD